MNERGDDVNTEDTCDHVLNKEWEIPNYWYRKDWLKIHMVILVPGCWVFHAVAPLEVNQPLCPRTSAQKPHRAQRCQSPDHWSNIKSIISYWCVNRGGHCCCLSSFLTLKTLATCQWSSVSHSFTVRCSLAPWTWAVERDVTDRFSVIVMIQFLLMDLLPKFVFIKGIMQHKNSKGLQR